MPTRAILVALDNTLLLEDDATEQALRQTADVGARRLGVDTGLIRDAAREAAETLFRSAQPFVYADQMGIWWGEALWGDFAGDAAGLRALRAFVPGYRREVWSRALSGAAPGGEALAGELAAADPAFRRALRPIDP